VRLKAGLIRWMDSLEGDNYFSAFEIWPYKMRGLSFKGDN